MRHPLTERWVSTLFRDWARMFRPRYGVERRFGRDLLIDQNCPVGRNMLSRGMWERPQIEFLEAEFTRRRRSETAVFLDIGAYWGLYSLYFEKQGIFDRIVAFEPNPRSQTMLKLHLIMNSIEGEIELLPFALSGEEGQARMVPQGGGGAHIDSDKGDLVIETRRLDDVVPLSDAFVVAKIDVEGHEGPVIAGMHELVANNRVLLQIEIFPQNVEKIVPKLESLGLVRLDQIKEDHFFTTAE